LFLRLMVSVYQDNKTDSTNSKNWMLLTQI
jgi:hypothetical protein